MTTIIDAPSNIDKSLIDQLINLIDSGNQVPREFIERGITNAELIALFVIDGEILCSATLKNPLKPYRDKVFQSAGAEIDYPDNLQELGYIITNPKHEGRKLCQELLKTFFETIGDRQMFATTRKPQMIHILKKFGFNKLGNKYKEDLELYIYKSDI